MNLTLARQAEKDVKSGNAEQDKGYCLRGARQFTEHTAIGTKYDRLFRGDGTARDATAARAGHRFLAAGLGFLRKDLGVHGGLQPGDMLVKTQVAPNRWGDYSGHIGVLCEDRERIAENSSTSIGRVHGALGFRTLSQFGDYDIVVRLPDPNVKAKPAPAARPLPQIPVPVYNGPGFDVVVNNTGANIGPGLIYYGDIYVPAREFLKQFDLDIIKSGDLRERAEQPRFYIQVGKKAR